jgi:hypothetical protein
MLASEIKLCENNLDIILAVLNALRVVRENGGYGGVECKVKDGLVVVVKAVEEWHI